ncbi:amino acid adenylation domain-containing protein [Nocardioides sp. KC13]|uniref:Amino acid adenylation domain-containing protein n=2 Tax=Nocardioides turkmenicus TaxID=2711220 RepID=A0A6M1R005_9ACTN|nr:amino acid adenylation domain-containing protein [Nocardioides sp. KC13]NGN92972.1 amino acid adenylation domain-containing protein [Nocardioides sp. KC13]
MRHGEHSAETIWALFDAQASSRPARTAVVDGTVDITYEQLRARAQVIADELVARGVAPGSLVGVCLGRTWELVATLLGVLRAGCGYVPLDPAYPSERVRYMVEHSRAVTVIVDDEAAELCAAAPDLVPLRTISDRRLPPGAEPVAGDIAYVIYTSGSTGNPKGVAVEHRSVVAMAKAMRRLLDEEDLGGVLAGASVCFDPSVMEILGTLMLGGTVVLAENVLALREVPCADRVRTTIMVPSAMKALLTAGPLPDGVRCVVLGGEVLTPSLVADLHAGPRPPRVLNVYGPTETTVFTTAGIVDAADEPITIGAPVAGARAYVLDESLQPVPAGEAGELFVAGDQLARGYLHDDERTRQRFLELKSDGPIPEKRIYRTGDLCRWTESGELEFLGRVDRQVKIRGHRIELDEIEVVLQSMPGVAEAAVVVDRAEGKGLLVAYVETQSESVSAASVRADLADQLPKYMTPHIVMPLAEMPRLPNGKVDRHRLPAVRRTEGVAGGPTATETRQSSLLDAVRNEVAVLLGSPAADSVPPKVSLESLGLDSLDVAELTVRLSQVLATSLPSSTLDELMTVEDAADALSAIRRASGGREPDGRPNGVGAAARLPAFQAQIRSGHPPAFAAKIPAWSAIDKGALVQHLRSLLSRSGLDPYGKVVRTGSAERGTVVDVHTGEEREAIIWTTNLYLGFNRDEKIIEEARNALSRFGTGMGISAAGSGQTDLHVEFEREFAAIVGKPSACLLPTGFTASLGAIAGVVGEGDVVVMDQLCHASLVDGARLSGARVRTFRHNDTADLRAVLEAESSPHHTTLVVLESVYSMGEGAAPLRDIVPAAKEFGALVLVDEAHSFGLYGGRGAGLCAAEGVTEHVDLILTTLSKALGSIGGVVAAQEPLIALLRSSARAYVFQANTSPADIAAALAALRRVGESDALRERLWDTANYMRERFAAAGYELGTGDGLIITPHFSDGKNLRAIARGLFERGIHTAAVTYPIVERSRGRLRFICSASHTREDVDRTLQALVEAEAEATRRTASDGAASQSHGVESPASRCTVTGWAEAFTAYLNTTLAELPTAVPSLVVTIESPDEEDVVVRIDERGATRGADVPAEALACSLRLLDAGAVAALSARDPESLLASIIDGRCALGGHTQPFVWFIGRLADWQRTASEPLTRVS